MLTDTIKKDMQEAMKAREELKLSVLRSALSAFTNELVSKGKKPTDQLEDADVIAVMKRLAKQRKEAAEQFENGNRPELAQKERDELVIIEAYLPQSASPEEIEVVVKKKIAEMNADASKTGVVIGAVMKELGGNADGTAVKEMVQKNL